MSIIYKKRKKHSIPKIRNQKYQNGMMKRRNICIISMYQIIRKKSGLKRPYRPQPMMSKKYRKYCQK